MTAETTTFAPLPVRRRDTLEVFDTALKLYKRYFWVLLAWSAISTIASYVVSAVTCGAPVAMFFTLPLMVGATSCAIAAAVRGQNITFSQCWRFFKPRYWPTVGQYVLTFILGMLGLMGLAAIGTIIVILIVAALAAASLPTAIYVTVWIVLTLVMTVVGSILGSAILCWMYMVPIIVCLEDDKRGGLAQSRAWDLLRKNWLRTTMLFALVGLSFLATAGITAGFVAVISGLDNLRKMVEGNASDDAIWVMLFAGGGLWTILLIITTPLYYLVTGVFYLDLRVRKEALDLEWNAHVSAPPGQAVTGATQAPTMDAASAGYAPPAAVDIAPATFAAGAAAGLQAMPPNPPAVESLPVEVAPQAGTGEFVSRSVFDNPVAPGSVPNFEGGQAAPVEPEPPVYVAPPPYQEPPAATVPEVPPTPEPEPAVTSSFGNAVSESQPAEFNMSSFDPSPATPPAYEETSSFGGSSFAPPTFDIGSPMSESSFAAGAEPPAPGNDSGTSNPTPGTP